MIKEITRFQVSDGRVFETLQEAEKVERWFQFEANYADYKYHGDDGGDLGDWLLDNMKTVLKLYGMEYP